jgi:hypothetical protein
MLFFQPPEQKPHYKEKTDENERNDKEIINAFCLPR